METITSLHIVTTESRVFVDLTARGKGTAPLTEKSPGSLGDYCRETRLKIPGSRFNKRGEEALAVWSGTLEELTRGPAKEVITFYRKVENSVGSAECTVLTSRYGPIGVGKRIIPSWGNKSLPLPKKWLKELREARKILLAIPATQLHSLASRLAPHLANADICVVSGKPPGDYWFHNSEVHVRTRGVARIGSANYLIIKNWLKGDE